MPNPPRAPSRAAVFDLDGTLVDSMPLVFEMFRHAVEPFRASPAAEEILASLGGPPETCVRKLLGGRDGDLGVALGRMARYEREHLGRIAPFPGVREMLAELRSRGVRLGLWTGRDRASVEKILRAHALGEFFGAAVCGDDLASHKPDPEGLLQVVERLGSRPAKAVFVGDTEADVLGGRAAGVFTLFLHHGRPVPAGIIARADQALAHPGDILGALAVRFS